MDTWQILHIPDNPPIAPDQQPTVDVIASLIDPKFANTLVRRLNQMSPLENLRHVKRVKKKFVEGGKTQLSVILCLASENGNQLESMQNDVQELMNSYKLSPFITKVCKYAALSKEEWEEQCKLWPTSYHPPTYNIDGITGFSEEDSQSVFRFMKYAIQLAKSSDNLVVNSAVIVDPSVKQVITAACDQTCSPYSPTNKITLETSCCEKLEAVISHSDSDGVLSHETVHSNSFQDKSKQLYSSVSCLYPWQWDEQQSDMSSCYWHTDIFSPVWEKSKISLLKWNTCSLLPQALQQKDKRLILQMIIVTTIWTLIVKLPVLYQPGLIYVQVLTCTLFGSRA